MHAIMNYGSDARIVLTLDAGGTNMVFSAIQANEEIIEPVTVPTAADNLERCLAGIVGGFSEAMKRAGKKPAAISFAFPGPADYPAGIIGDLGNLPAFRGGVALGPMLHEKFRLPVFINNDGNLFSYGEAIAGLLPWLNSLLEDAGSPKRFSTLLGVTLGTGFGGGIVLNGRLHIGDNSSAGEIWLMRHKTGPGLNAEEGASIRAVRRFYAEEACVEEARAPEPADIYRIARGEKEGDRAAAKNAFARMGRIAGDAIANAVTLIDGPVVVGVGVSPARRNFSFRLSSTRSTEPFPRPAAGSSPAWKRRCSTWRTPRSSPRLSAAERARYSSRGAGARYATIRSSASVWGSRGSGRTAPWEWAPMHSRSARWTGNE